MILCVSVCLFSVRHLANRLSSMQYDYQLILVLKYHQLHTTNTQHQLYWVESCLSAFGVGRTYSVCATQYSTEYIQKDIVNICECLCGDWRNASFLYTYILATTFLFLSISLALHVTWLYLSLFLTCFLALVRSSYTLCGVSFYSFVHRFCSFLTFVSASSFSTESSLVRVSFAPLCCFIWLVGLSVGLSIRSFHFVSLSYVHCTAKRQRIDEKTHVKTDLSGHFFAFVQSKWYVWSIDWAVNWKFFVLYPVTIQNYDTVEF